MEARLVKIRDYLLSVYDYKDAIDRKHEQLIYLNQLARRSVSILSDTPGHSADGTRQFENAVIKVCALRDELAVLLSRYSETYKRINSAIESVNNPKHREVLELRYLNFKTWDQVADTIGKTHYHVTHRLHPDALDSLSESDYFKNLKNF